jgi:hypothetical protein
VKFGAGEGIRTLDPNLEKGEGRAPGNKFFPLLSNGNRPFSLFVLCGPGSSAQKGTTFPGIDGVRPNSERRYQKDRARLTGMTALAKPIVMSEVYDPRVFRQSKAHAGNGSDVKGR